jgi:hypothetical protein
MFPILNVYKKYLVFLNWVAYITTLFQQLDYIASMMTSERRRIGKHSAGTVRGVILRHNPGIRLEGLRKTTKIQAG